MISELTEGVYRCGSDRVNWYLVEGNNALTVIDTGFPIHWQQFLHRLDGLGYDRTDILPLSRLLSGGSRVQCDY